MDLATNVLPSKNEVARALVVKQLWDNALHNARSPNETTWIAALLTAGIAMETALRALPRGSNKRDDERSTYAMIADFARSHEAHVAGAMTKAAHALREARNAAQHEGAAYTQPFVRRTLEDAHPFLFHVVKAAFDVDLDILSAVDLLEDPVLRPALAAAQQRLREGCIDDALAIAGACYEQMRFRLSIAGTMARAPMKAHRLVAFLPKRLALLSEYLIDLPGIHSGDLVGTEDDLEDNANRLFAQLNMGMEALTLASFESLRGRIGQQRVESRDQTTSIAASDEWTSERAQTLLDTLIQHVWSLEQSQPSMFGRGWVDFPREGSGLTTNHTP